MTKFNEWAKNDLMIQAREAREAATTAKETAADAREAALRHERLAAACLAAGRIEGAARANAQAESVKLKADDLTRFAANLDRRALRAEAAANASSPQKAALSKPDRFAFGPAAFDAATLAKIHARSAAALANLSAAQQATPGVSGERGAMWDRARAFNAEPRKRS